MVKFARGLKLVVKNRDSLKEYVKENAHDPGATMENWGEDRVPKAIYINKYKDYDDEPCYKTVDEHVNESTSWNYWSVTLIDGMLDEGILTNTGQYDKEFVEENSD